jgi:hypothetical protein
MKASTGIVQDGNSGIVGVGEVELVIVEGVD